MSQSTLWAPWRIDYILNKDSAADKPREAGCLFCRLLEEENDRKNLILDRTRFSFVMLNRYPYSNCHLLVLPRTHAADLDELTEEAYIDLLLLMKRAIKCLQQAVKPAGINAGINMGEAAGAGIADHLHFHIVPRWQGDHNFMPVIADTMVLPQQLESSYEMLKPYFEGRAPRKTENTNN
ncbi:MAG: HIT domain-containing protein [Deltaproteobacteria bacterium]|nr:HIT domain-containing protein [Deltaproteobacteria bacterium]